jgi:2-dehydro-3-deoxy-D-arabinonate dehydratase
MQIVRSGSPTARARLALLDGPRLWSLEAAHGSLADLLRLSADELRARLEALARNDPSQASSERLRAPIDGQTEVWAAGVTYQRSEEARVEESGTPDIYTRVYTAERPELFFKATARRVAGPEEPIAVRTDSTWDVPEPELALVVNARAEIVGYTVANDVSSRSIEGDNPLYLPQAKVYAGSCALGPGVTPAWDVPDPYALGIRMNIACADGTTWSGQTSTSELKRGLEELVEYLFREDTFPDGVILCTGTALVPESPFTLEQDDVVEIEIDQLGTLRNPVVRGKAGLGSGA